MDSQLTKMTAENPAHVQMDGQSSTPARGTEHEIADTSVLYEVDIEDVPAAMLCVCCKEKLALKACSGCLGLLHSGPVLYCSKECQVADRPLHRKRCNTAQFWQHVRLWEFPLTSELEWDDVYWHEIWPLLLEATIFHVSVPDYLVRYLAVVPLDQRPVHVDSPPEFTMAFRAGVESMRANYTPDAYLEFTASMTAAREYLDFGMGNDEVPVRLRPLVIDIETNQTGVEIFMNDMTVISTQTFKKYFMVEKCAFINPWAIGLDVNFLPMYIQVSHPYDIEEIQYDPDVST